MLKLMKLELRKFKIMTYVRSAAIANLILFGFLMMMSYSPEFDGTTVFEDYATLFDIIDILARGTFIIFAAVLLGRFVIDEFNQKTITVLFMYPINRYRLIAAKLAIVVLFTFVSIILSIAFLSSLYLIVDHFTHFVPDELTMTLVMQWVVKLSFNALSASFIALIPLYFGMRKFSLPTTIVSAVILVMVTCSNNGGFKLNDIIIIPIFLALVGAAIGYMAIRKVDQIDIH